MQACFHVGQEERGAEGPQEHKWEIGALLQPDLIIESYRERVESEASR